MSELRTERSFGVTAQLTSNQRARLHAFRESDTYNDVLDVLEMVCIEKESELINTSPADRAAVLAHHQMAKAAWQIFTHIQDKIASETHLYLQSIDKQPAMPPLSARERLIDNILNPLLPAPDEDEPVM